MSKLKWTKKPDGMFIRETRMSSMKDLLDPEVRAEIIREQDPYHVLKGAAHGVRRQNGKAVRRYI